MSLTLLGKSNHAKDVQRLNMMVGGLVFGLGFYSVLGMAAGMAFSDTNDERAHAATTFGMTGMCFSIMYYAAPLSTALRVIATKDASSFYAPMIALNFTNALMWMFYGFVGIGQPSVWAPNMVGCALAIFQLFLIFIYRNSSGSPDEHKAFNDSTGKGELASPLGTVVHNPTEGVHNNAAKSPMWADVDENGSPRV
jgi:uncharacterized protein with PQ loop repeat